MEIDELLLFYGVLLCFIREALDNWFFFSWEESVRILKQQQGRVHKVQAKGEGNKNVSENLKTAQIKICQNKALV